MRRCQDSFTAARPLGPIMNRRWKWIIGVVLGLVVAIVAGSCIYAKFINKADPEFDQSTVNERLNAATTTTVAGASTVASDPSATSVQSTTATTQSTS